MSLHLWLTCSKVGMGQPEVLIPMGVLLSKELTIRTSFRYGVSSDMRSCVYNLNVVVAR
jgi:hypothetical protein